MPKRTLRYGSRFYRSLSLVRFLHCFQKSSSLFALCVKVKFACQKILSTLASSHRYVSSSSKGRMKGPNEFFPSSFTCHNYPYLLLLTASSPHCVKPLDLACNHLIPEFLRLSAKSSMAARRTPWLKVWISEVQEYQPRDLTSMLQAHSHNVWQLFIGPSK